MNGKVDRYIDADQHTLSPTTPTFGNPPTEREVRLLWNSVRAHTAKRLRGKDKSNLSPPQPFLGLPRVKWVPEKGMLRPLVAFPQVWVKRS